MRSSSPDKSIFKRRRGSKFTTLPNAVYDHPDLSFEAMGFLGCIMRLPEDWNFNRAWAHQRYGIGRERLERIIKELMKADYVRREQERDKGRLGAAVYVFSDEPGEFGDCTIPALSTVGGFAADGSAADGKPAATKDLSKRQRNIELTKGRAVENAGKRRGAHPKEVASSGADAAAEAMRSRFSATLKEAARKMRARAAAPEPGTGRAAELAGRRAAMTARPKPDPRQIDLEDAIKEAAR